MAQARLDRIPSMGADPGGLYGLDPAGKSNPKLVERLGRVVGNTPEEIARVRGIIEEFYPPTTPANITARKEIEAMIFDQPANEILEAA